MASTDKKIWFPAKRYGWGWGLPVAWQGWVVLSIYLLGIVASAWLVPPDRLPYAYATCIAALSIVLIGVCWMKGEKPKWRWGSDN